GLVDANREGEVFNRQAPRSRGLVEHTRSDEITQVQRLDEGDIVERRPSGGKRPCDIRDDTASGIHVHELADVKATGRYSAGETGEGNRVGRSRTRRGNARQTGGDAASAGR